MTAQLVLGFLVARVISVDDAGHQLVAHDILGGESHEADAVHILQGLDGVGQGQEGTGPAAAVNAALQALAGGDLEGAVGALDKLTGAPAEAARPWLRMAKERLAAEAALQRIEALLVTRLGTPATPPTGSGAPR